MLAHSFLIKSSSKLLVTRTGKKSSDEFDFGPLVSMAHLYVFEMRFDLGTLDSGERSLPFGLLVYEEGTYCFWCESCWRWRWHDTFLFA